MNITTHRLILVEVINLCSENLPQVCFMQWPWHVRYSSQRSLGHGEAAGGEDSCASSAHWGLLLPVRVTLPVDNVQFNHLCGSWQFLQSESSSWATTGWEHDRYLSLGVSERDAQSEDLGPAQQPLDKCSCGGSTLPG